MSDLISRQAAIDATWFEPYYADPLNVLTEVRDRIDGLPSATPTLYGYPIEHLAMIASVMAKENCTPEAVAQILQNAKEIAKIVRDEMLGMFNESIERTCKGVANEEGMDHRVGFRKGRIPDRIQSKR